MVADRFNSQDFLLNSEIEFKREILSKEDRHSLRYPRGIILDETNGRLLVAENEQSTDFDFS